ncbi:hypothetical protein EMIHUDRAFT_312548 [Emiliania huxleyi CCMP1516]|uniref:NAD(P)(+)--arginine ADP-ribosyltransferase n=2 Tax=Emiliania huxleyi TaxID=2903 RepID=A0A0D3HZU4_EMIH1|nr:hypothetical protein EMIHUDRAFT_312548 [Emiliania huxleyi CCMP1516]EOD04529.1 hypothetical protein EMIHUDRAFT_312548 [Emiliania huxleyi CCMP1516]|eukprot:XP_005756958.1 hypothetical protein EMIHUDRAFT_312548 [Emiliania huxleyi CCMP1516]
MCVNGADLAAKRSQGLAAIRAEVAANGTVVDKECLEYVLDKVAGESGESFQGGLMRDCDANGNVLPSRRGKRLADFLADPSAQTAKLEEAHVAALRFYTTAAFQTINNGLRDQGRYEAKRPHPFPVTVKLIQEALLKLRANDASIVEVDDESEQANTEMTFYRGMKDMKAKGGTELAPMSTTSSLKVAMQTKNFMVRGPDISFLSAFPAEEEFLFPPLTYLEPTGNVQKLRVDDAMFTVVDVRPQQ